VITQYIFGVTCPICDSAQLVYWEPTETVFCEHCRTRWDKEDLLGITGPMWVDRRGIAMPISKMGERHLRNSIARIWRSGGKWRGRFMAPLLKELENRIKNTG